MALPKLTARPTQAGYTVQDGASVLAVSLDGGASRMRRDVLGAVSTVTVQWTADGLLYRYLRAFFRSAIASGADPFLIDLVLDEAGVTEHVARVQPGSWKLSSAAYGGYVVQATLEVVPLPIDGDYDAAVLLLYDLYGDETGYLMLDLERLVNVSMPDALA